MGKISMFAAVEEPIFLAIISVKLLQNHLNGPRDEFF
jgi:hypothetical protein